MNSFFDYLRGVAQRNADRRSLPRSWFDGLMIDPLRGKVSRVSILKDGQVSVVLRFGIDERDRAQQLSPGTLMQISTLSGRPKDVPREKS